MMAVVFLAAGFPLSAFAQNSSPPDSARGASFLPADAKNPNSSDAAFSGLATAPPVSVLPTAQAPAANKTSDLIPAPVSAAPLPNVSPESIGLPSADGLGADMWKGTSRPAAEHLLEIIAPTASPVLNTLARRLLATAAVPPDGAASSAQKLTSERIEKLAAFGSGDEAWALAKNADGALIDDVNFHRAAEAALLGNDKDLCGKAPEFAKARATVDWQGILIACQLRGGDTKAAQVALDVFRTQANRDNIFIGIADKNILGAGKMLPFQLTPLTPATLALLQIAKLPLPGAVYAHPDFALAPALLQIPAQQGIAQLSLAERAAARGMIDSDALAAVYRATNFNPEALASPLTSGESGLRLRALLFRAAEGEKDSGKRIALAAKFVQSVSPDFLDGMGSVTALMLGDIKADPSLAANAAIVARIYVLAGRGDQALDWLRLAQQNGGDSTDLLDLWPQFALAGLEAKDSYAADFDKWLNAALKSADPVTVRDHVGATLLFLDAAGLNVPDTAWVKVLTTTHNEKPVAFSPLLCERMREASAQGRRAETVLLAVAAAGEGDIPLPVAVGITRALRLAGFKSEAATFARQEVALLGKGG
ncbi:MAG: hypothetical protein P4M13_08185 [Alphaproteobacteria bacterium]|nr:hypothetical protein [Alphaproteobacteria bacterium]